MPGSEIAAVREVGFAKRLIYAIGDISRLRIMRLIDKCAPPLFTWSDDFTKSHLQLPMETIGRMLEATAISTANASTTDDSRK